MAKIIDSRTALDRTVKIFDDFYNFSLKVPADEYDIVYSYFKGICASTQIAANFTVFLFKISQETGIPTVTLIENLKGKTNLQVNQLMAYYLNSFKSKTTMYGISIVPQASQPVARNIVQ